ncbi:hypothetical protein EDD85DRAFT_770189 [Armillaria nabsnona]|nr:hypothetical protein EDD85DRAFT_770189 [Armillaria nabsnona]
MSTRDGSEALSYTDPHQHHHISSLTSSKVYLAPWLQENSGDVACNDFIRRLKDHLLSQILDRDELFMDLDHQNLIIVNNCLYSHQILRINYTTYDAHQDQDSINPCTHSNIMALSPLDPDPDHDSHLYLYTRVVGIFHATICHVGPKSLDCATKTIQFLWVQWYAFDPDIPSGFKAKHLPCIGFLPGDDPQAFGFLSSLYWHISNRVLHIVPAYIYGQTSEILLPSICRRFNENHMDWVHYYVDM